MKLNGNTKNAAAKEELHLLIASRIFRLLHKGRTLIGNML
jgi:hypothetical protein